MSVLQEIRVPDIGGVNDVEVIELLAAVGDLIEVGQALLNVETDKATVEVPSSAAGRIAEIKVEVGAKLSEGSIIATVETGDSLLTPLVDHARPASQNTAAPGDMESVSRNEPAHLPQVTSSEPISHVEKIPPYSSPSIRLLARELDVHLPEVSGTGARGRIIRDDVINHVRAIMQDNKEGDSQSRASSNIGLPRFLPWPKVDFEKYGPITRCALSRIRKISGENLHRNWVNIPHVTNHEEADITELEAFRRRINQEQANSGVKVTLLALLIKSCAVALKKFPEFNASLDGDELVLKNYYHIGFAADTPHGLLVPVVKDVEQKGLLAIAQEVSDLAAKAREGKLTMEQVSGGCFTISSLGGIGGTYFTPIINAPEVAILGVSRARHQMIWNGQSAEPRLILPMSLSWDHRVIDGASAGRFNAYLADILMDMRRAMM